MSKAWKRTIWLTFIFLSVLGLIVAIPGMISGLLPYTLSHGRNRAEAMRQLEQLMPPDEKDFLANTRKTHKSPATYAQLEQLASEADNILRSFMAMKVETTGPILPRPTLNYDKYFKQTEDIFKAIPLSGETNIPLYEQVRSIDISRMLLYKAILAQQNVVSLDENIRRLKLLLDIPPKVDPYYNWYSLDFARIFADLLEESWDDKAKLDKVETLIKYWKPERSAFYGLALWMERRIGAVEGFYVPPFIDNRFPKYPTWTNELGKFLPLRMALNSNTYERAIKIMNELKAGEDDPRNAFVTFSQALDESKQARLIELASQEGSAEQAVLQTLSSVIHQTAAKRALRQAIAVAKAKLDTGRFPAKLPLPGQDAINPLRGTPIEYSCSQESALITMRADFAPLPQQSKQSLWYVWVHNLQRLKRPNRFDIRLGVRP